MANRRPSKREFGVDNENQNTTNTNILRKLYLIASSDQMDQARPNTKKIAATHITTQFNSQRTELALYIYYRSKCAKKKSISKQVLFIGQGFVLEINKTTYTT